MSESSCGSCPSAGGCSPADQEQCGVDPAEQRMQRVLGKIKHKIVVLSGKGGVGKSSVAVNIAVTLALAGKRVGLLDIDVHGPSVPRLLSLQGSQPQVTGENVFDPIPWSQNLSVMSLGFLLPNAEQAVVWRGPVKMGMITQFVRDVNWGELDYLVVDCPPGTGDEPLTALQTLGPDAKAVVVTTPQAVAIDDVRRSVSFCRELGNPVLGIVENMSGFVCSHCNQIEHVFGEGGGEELAREMGAPFLGRIPLDPEMVRAADEGYVFMKAKADTPAGQAIQAVVQPILDLP